MTRIARMDCRLIGAIQLLAPPPHVVKKAASWVATPSVRSHPTPKTIRGSHLLLAPSLDALRYPADQGGVVAQDLADFLALGVIAQSICKPFQPVPQIGQRNGLLFHRGPDLESLQKGQHIIDLPAHYP